MKFAYFDTLPRIRGWAGLHPADAHPQSLGTQNCPVYTEVSNGGRQKLSSEDEDQHRPLGLYCYEIVLASGSSTQTVPQRGDRPINDIIGAGLGQNTYADYRTTPRRFQACHGPAFACMRSKARPHGGRRKPRARTSSSQNPYGELREYALPPMILQILDSTDSDNSAIASFASSELRLLSLSSSIARSRPS